jgi:hypothetical protein
MAVAGVHGHPGDLGRLVEVALDGEEPHDRMVEHGHQAGLTADGVGALAPAVLLAEVVGQAGDDLVAALGVLGVQRSDLDLGHGVLLQECPAAARRPVASGQPLTPG